MANGVVSYELIPCGASLPTAKGDVVVGSIGALALIIAERVDSYRVLIWLDQELIDHDTTIHPEDEGSGYRLYYCEHGVALPQNNEEMLDELTKLIISNLAHCVNKQYVKKNFRLFGINPSDQREVNDAATNIM